MVSTQLELRKKTRHPDGSITFSLINNSFWTRMFEEIETQPDIALHQQKKMSRSLKQNTIKDMHRTRWTHPVEWQRPCQLLCVSIGLLLQNAETWLIFCSEMYPCYINTVTVAFDLSLYEWKYPKISHNFNAAVKWKTKAEGTVSQQVKCPAGAVVTRIDEDRSCLPLEKDRLTGFECPGGPQWEHSGPFLWVYLLLTTQPMRGDTKKLELIY